MIGEEHNSIDKLKNKGNTLGKGSGNEQRTAHFNKMMYMSSFGIHLDLPTAYILDAAIFEADRRYCIQVIKYILPSENRTNVTIYPPMPQFDELNENGNIAVRLQR